MKAVLTTAFASLAAAASYGGTMPARAEIERAMPAVRKAMADDWAAMERGEMSPAAVADNSLKRGHEAKSVAEKFMLLKGAAFLFVQSGLSDKAAESICDMRTEFKDMPEEVPDEIVKQATGDRATAKMIMSKIRAIRDEWKIPGNFTTPLVQRLYLSKDVTIDFAAIPPGTFRMSDAGGKSSHKVTISRPFWISCTYVTSRQYDAAAQDNAKPRNKTAVEYEKLFPDADVAMFRHTAGNYEQLCSKLNAKFAGRLPQGYEFRLPTEAEFEYALREGNGKATDLIAEKKTMLRCKTKGVDFKGGVRLLPRNGANGWGVAKEFVEAVHVMDKVDVPENLMHMRKDGFIVNNATVNKIAAYADGETDPLRSGKYRLIRHFKNIRIIGKYHYGLARIVIGPKLRRDAVSD